MALNKYALNSQAVNGPTPDPAVVIGTGSGEVISFEQSVVRTGSGEVISFEQEVVLNTTTTGSTLIISIEQVVENTFSGNVISFEQRVRDISTPDHLSRTGWDLTLFVGSLEIPRDQITGRVEISRGENDASLMTCTLRPDTGVQDIDTYYGKTVYVDIQTANGTYRGFTGVVDIPEVDLIDETITLRCTDRRTEQLNGLPRERVDTIGVYSNLIFEQPKDIAQEIEQRLTTTPTAVDFDAYGNYTVTPWAAKSTADFTFTGSDLYRERPMVDFNSRGRAINQVNLNFGYRFERFYHHTRNWVWTSPTESICNVLVNGYSLTPRRMILDAINAAGWPLKGSVTFTDIAEAGWYNCSTGLIGWMPTIVQGETIAVEDETGAQINDINGNPLYSTQVTGITDSRALFASGASWQATQQWAQTVTENYGITVKAPQSINQIGTIAQDLTYGIEDLVDTQEWEDYQYYRDDYGLGNNYYVDQDTKRAQMQFAQVVALNQAKTTILDSHRDTRVSAQMFPRPDVDLKHTVRFNTGPVDAKGKVYGIRHTFDMSTTEATTEITIILSRSSGSATADGLKAVTQPSDNVAYNTGNITLRSRYGQDPSTTTGSEKWTGFIGNAYLGSSVGLTNFPTEFRVDAPAVPDELRASKTLEASQNFNIEIPNDSLTITFDGVS